MASTESHPVNGSYAPQGYDANYATANSNTAASYGNTQAAPSQPAAASSEIPKEEVAWYFVEQYYTTLSKSPDRLSLFYNKRSQLVYGTEEEKVQVSIGQERINERIKELDFADTKVRVTNVDSQSSDANIVIQVIGEISNKGQPHKRFVQTFILAEQPKGYFVLNDIFRYLAEEPEEEEELQPEPAAPVSGVQEPTASVTVPETTPQNQSDEVSKNEEDLSKVDHKLEEAAQEEPAKEVSPAPAAVNGTPVADEAEVAVAEDAPVAAVSTDNGEANKETEAPVEEQAPEAEKPKDPTPTPAPAPQKAALAPAPAAPAKPRSWASLAASAHKVAMPAVPTSMTPQAAAQSKAPAPNPSQPLSVPAQSAPAREPSPANSQGETSGWQTATGHKKEQSRAQNQAPAEDSDPKRAYIKNVYSQVEEGALRQAMSKFGEVTYLDISRPKNCAFVDFKTPAAFQAALGANPHTINGVELKVEERRLRPGNFGPFPTGAPRGRGGVGNRGGRGSFPPRGNRGSGSVRGGRGGPQEA